MSLGVSGGEVKASKVRRETKSFILFVVFIALGVALSPIYYPIGPTKAFPIQHAINVLSGVFLGPLWAPLAAVLIGTLRISMGMGTIFSYPGGIPGALLVGLAYRCLKRDYTVFFEPVGTSIGAVISALTLAPLMGRGMPPILGIEDQALLYLIFWLPSTLTGTVMGYFILKALRMSGIDKRIS